MTKRRSDKGVGVVQVRYGFDSSLNDDVDVSTQVCRVGKRDSAWRRSFICINTL